MENFSFSQFSCESKTSLKSSVRVYKIDLNNRLTTYFMTFKFIFKKYYLVVERFVLKLSSLIFVKALRNRAWWATVHGVAKSQTRLSDFAFTFHFHALEKEMAAHSSVLAWRIPGTGEPGGLPSLGSHRLGHDGSDLAAAAALLHRLNLTNSPERLNLACTEGLALSWEEDLHSARYREREWLVCGPH